jgi:hypothetical protein
MAAHATATFQIENWDESEILETEGGSKVTHAKVSKSFEGDLEGEGTVEWLMAYDDSGSATFVGLERISGKIGDKSGTFVLQHIGTFDGKSAKAQLQIVPGSGTGDFRGLEGQGSFEAGMGEEGERSVTLDYDV